MAEPPLPAPGSPARPVTSPLARSGRTYVHLGITIAVAAAGVIALSDYNFVKGLVGGLFVPVAAFLAWYGAVVGTIGKSTPFFARAADLIQRGRFGEAEAVLAEIPAKLAKRALVVRRLGVQRAEIALLRGEVDAAVAHATTACAAWLGAVAGPNGPRIDLS